MGRSETKRLKNVKKIAFRESHLFGMVSANLSKSENDGRVFVANELLVLLE